jgi:hypothetical protein
MGHPAAWTSALLVVLAGACATTRSVREEAQTSGFLGDYSQLRPGEDGQAQLVYAKPGLDLSGYRAIRVEPVALWGGEKMKSLPREDQQRMVDSLHAALTSKLAQDWTLVDQSGPGVLVVRAAITSAEPSNVPLDVVASVIPQVALLSKLAGIAADSSLTVGEAAAEMEITDGASGERVLAAVDKRVGGRSWTGMTNKWSDVEEAYAYWAERVSLRLAERSGRAPTPAAEK